MENPKDLGTSSTKKSVLAVGFSETSMSRIWNNMRKEGGLVKQLGIKEDPVPLQAIKTITAWKEWSLEDR